MPLVFSRKIAAQRGILALWQIAEDEDFFLEKLELTAPEHADLAPLKDLRRLEWLACRWLLHEISGHNIRLPLAKDAFSKPFFPENEHLACSLSHSKGVVAALLTLDVGHGTLDTGGRVPMSSVQCPTSIGCDLQKIVPKMPALAPKFMRPEELAFVREYPDEAEQLALLHVFWTAKESLYKAWGKKELDFRAHLRVEPFHWQSGTCATRGYIEKGMARLVFDIFSERLEVPGAGSFILTWAMEATAF